MGTATEQTLRRILDKLEEFVDGEFAPSDAEFVVTALDAALSQEILHSALTGADLHAPKAHKDSHDPADGSDALDTAAASTIQPDDSAAEGSAHSLARSDHKHAIAAAAPSAVGDANAEGISTSFARADHVHNRHQDALQVFLANSKPFNSKGNEFDTIQAAIDDLAGDGWVYVPPGTWNESLVIDETFVELFGSGGSPSAIDGSSTDSFAISISGGHCVIHDLHCTSNKSGAGDPSTIMVTGGDASILNVLITSSDSNAGIFIDSTASNCLIQGCYIYDSGEDALRICGPRTRVIGNTIDTAAAFGIRTTIGADDSIFTCNIIRTTGDDGIYIQADAENCVVDGNRITGWTNEAIDDNSGTSTIGDNDTT